MPISFSLGVWEDAPAHMRTKAGFLWSQWPGCLRAYFISVLQVAFPLESCDLFKNDAVNRQYWGVMLKKRTEKVHQNHLSQPQKELCYHSSLFHKNVSTQLWTSKQLSMGAVSMVMHRHIQTVFRFRVRHVGELSKPSPPTPLFSPRSRTDVIITVNMHPSLLPKSFGISEMSFRISPKTHRV